VKQLYGTKGCVFKNTRLTLSNNPMRMLKFLKFFSIFLIPTFACISTFAQTKVEPCKGAEVEKWNNCFGVYSPVKGEKFVGVFVEGNYFRGTYYLPSGERYTGRINPEGKWHGLGTYTFPSGEMYIGQWRNGEVTDQSINVGVGEKIPMIKVINACDTRSRDEFSDVAGCIKRSYQAVGASPNSQEIKNFYLLLDGVMEDFNRGNFGLAKAKAEVIKAWQSTIDSSNKRNEDAAANSRPIFIPPPLGGPGTGGIDSFTRNQMYQDCLQRAARDFRTCIP